MEVGLNEIVGSLLLHHKLWTGCLCPQLLSPPPLHHLLGDLLHPLQLQLGFAGNAADLYLKYKGNKTGFTESRNSGRRKHWESLSDLLSFKFYCSLLVRGISDVVPVAKFERVKGLMCLYNQL